MNRDTTWYSILDDEWPEVRNHISTWLEDDNFDENGKSKSSLATMMKERTPSTRRMPEN